MKNERSIKKLHKSFEKQIEHVVDQDIKKNIASLLKVYKVYDSNGEIKSIRLGRDNDGGYIVPELALRKADALIGYGIADDYSFEEQFSDKYNKPSFGFDCGLSNVNSENKLFTFVQECIASDKFLYSVESSSKKISSYTSQIKALNLSEKKIFIKMDIEGAEYKAFEDILNHSSNITGIVLEIHFLNKDLSIKAVDLLKKIQQHFLLTHVHGNNCPRIAFTSENSIGEIPRVLELTYINKELVNTYHISDVQNHPVDLDMPNCPKYKDFEFEIALDSN